MAVDYIQRKPLAANTAEALAVAANADGGGAVFELAQPDSMFIPYGEYPHKVGRQVFDQAAAEGMIAANKSLLATFGKWLLGKNDYPVYVGHPDLPGSKDTDKKAYGWIDGMVAENDGMRLSVRWSPAGKELVENAHYRFYSPMWWLQKTKRGLVPVGLKSVGLTNDPNIPVPALANDADAATEPDPTDPNELQEPTEIMNPAILQALGLAPEATPEDALAAIQALTDKCSAMEADKTAAQNACDAEKTAKEAAANSLAEKVVELTAARAALSIAANHAVAGAVASGRVLPAEADAKAAELLAANDLAAGLQALGTLPAKFKTESATGDLGTAKSRLVVAANDESANNRSERALLVANEFAATNPALSTGERKRIAWQRAQAKNPALFGKKSPDATA